MSKEYDEYLNNHIKAVKICYKLLTGKSLKSHDDSKFKKQMYDIYDQYFYGKNPDEDLFNYAWLIHQNREPHHWQYWVLIKDTGKIVPMKMPKRYVNEMIADWASFSFKDKNPHSLASWYNEQKEGIKFHEDTRKEVEKLIPIMIKKLEEYFKKEKINNEKIK